MVQEDSPRPVFVLPAEQGWHILVHVQPGAKRSEFVGLHDDCLRIRLAAPAVEGKANKALLALIAKALSLRTARVRLVSGDTGRRKRLLVTAEAEPDWSVLLPER
ncbi:DUF167 domain-containing protein [Desulfovibrio sp. OttesenSCG-928-F20]|nr:DUF167 domain-containing protein [Desulfovibrio sp. OttesenSCG-928-F20]